MNPDMAARMVELDRVGSYIEWNGWVYDDDGGEIEAVVTLERVDPSEYGRVSERYESAFLATYRSRATGESIEGPGWLVFYEYVPSDTCEEYGELGIRAVPVDRIPPLEPGQTMVEHDDDGREITTLLTEIGRAVRSVCGANGEVIDIAVIEVPENFGECVAIEPSGDEDGNGLDSQP